MEQNKGPQGQKQKANIKPKQTKSIDLEQLGHSNESSNWDTVISSRRWIPSWLLPGGRRDANVYMIRILAERTKQMNTRLLSGLWLISENRTFAALPG